MVKGVNKTIIEVNNTGSKVFERGVFYVSPSCSNMSAKNLNRAIKNFTFLIDERPVKGYKTVRQRRQLRRRILLAAAGVVVLTAAVLIIAL